MEAKYEKMAEQFRKDGCDEWQVKKFIQEEMAADKARAKRGTTDPKALAEWQALSEETRESMLTHAFCVNCGNTTLVPEYNFRRTKFILTVEGTCAQCGSRVNRSLEKF